MTSHNIPEETLNSAIEYCINEYVRLMRDREILREHWFGGLSMAAIAEKHELSVTAVQRIIHEVGDGVLLRAAVLSENGRRR